MNIGTISLIATIAFVVIIIIGFLIGMWRGLKRSTLNLVLSVVAAIVAFFASGALTKTILGIRLGGGKGTINSYFIDLLKGNNDIKLLIDSTPSLETFISNIPYAIGNVVIFILLTMALQFVMYIIYKIFAAIFIKKKDKEGNKLPRHRLTGGIVGAIKAFVLTLFAVMPFVSLVGTFDNVAKSNGLYSTDKSSPMYVTSQVVGGVNKSAFGVLGNFFGLDDAMFDYLSEFNIGKEKIKIREEINNYNALYATISQFKVIVNGNNGKSFKTTDFTHLDKTLEKVLASGLYNSVVSDVLNSVIVNYENYSFLPANGDVTRVVADIKTGIENSSTNEYFAHDIRAIYGAFKTLAQSGALDEQSSQDILNKLGGEYCETTKSALNQVFSMNILRDSTSSIADITLNKFIKDLDRVVVDGRELTDEDWSNFADSIVNIVNSFSELASNTDISGILADPMSILSDDVDITKTLNSLGEIVDEVREIKILRNAEGQPVVDSFLNNNSLALPTKQVKNGNGELETISNYKQLMNFIARPLNELKETGVYPVLSEESVSEIKVFTTFADAVTKDNKKLNKILIPLLEVEPTKTLMKDMLADVGGSLINFSALSSTAEYERDLTYITNILIEMVKTNGAGETYLNLLLNGSFKDMLKSIDEQFVEQLVPNILYAKSTEKLREELFTIYGEVYCDLVEDIYTFDYTTVSFNENSAENQAMEITAVFKEFIAFYPTFKEGDTVLDLDMIGLGKFMDRIKENAYRTTLAGKSDTGLFYNSFGALVQKVATEFGIQDKIDSDYSKMNFEELFTQLKAMQGA